MKTATIMYKICRQAYQRDYGMYPFPSYEIKVIQGENEYGLHELVSVKISQALTTNSGIDVGNANSSVCKLTIKESSENWARMAKFTVQFRMVYPQNSISSEWITAGVFWTDERSEDKSGNLLITGYDAMLMHERTWTDKIPQALLPASFPITSRAWATMIQNAELAIFDDVTQLDDTIALVGLNTSSTIRDVLKSIAAVHAGNWAIFGEDTLALIPFVNVDSSETTKYVTLGYDGIQASQFETTPAFDEVTGVHLETDSGTVMEAGDSTGYMMKSSCSVSTTAGVAALCLSKIDGYVYKPFTASNARLDPLVDIGDSVLIDEEIYQIMSIDWDFSKSVTANIDATFDQEIDHEYTIPGEDTKVYRKTLSLVDEKMGDYVPWDEFDTAIEQNEQAINLVASHTFVTQTVFNQEISAIQSQLDGSIQTWSGNAVPTLNNTPASNWTTDALKAEHVGDTYFINSDAGIPEAGNYYRFEVNNGVYSWQLLTDSALTEALAQAAAALAAAEDAQDTADESLAEAQSKGRIFVSQPTDAQAYDVGDLWVNATYGSTYSNDVLKCKTAKAAGDTFNIAHWEKASKYTDDSAVNTLRQEVIAEFSVQSDNIAAKVSKQGGSNAANSFSWQLTDSGHKWYANGASDPVVSITGTGLAVKGEINATSGFIGNGSYGFTIGSTSIYNGMTSMSDTDHYGVYVGTDGIALGKGAFRVTNTGALYAQSGTFEGNVYAKNIDYGGNYGTLSGAGITPYTIGDSNIARAGDYGALTTAALSQGVQGSLALADGYGLAITQGTSSYPPYFTAGSIYGTSSVASRTFSVENSSGVELYHLNDHYHSFTEVNGKIVIGIPNNSSNVNDRSFNIADTQTYRDGVAAVSVASRAVLYCNATNYNSFDTGFDCDMSGSSYHYDNNGSRYGRLEIRNSSGTALKTIRVKLPAGSAGSIGNATVQPSTDTTSDITIDSDAGKVYLKTLIKGYQSSSSTTPIYTQDNVECDITTAAEFVKDVFETNYASVLATDSTNYTSYDTGYSWGTRLYNPNLSNGGSSVYGRVGLYSRYNSLRKTYRFSLSMSVQSASTSSDYSDYYTSGGEWYLKVHVKNSSTEIYQTGINVQHAVNYGGTLSWDIHQHYDMGQADGWDCVVTTGSGQQHTFWSPSRIYQ